jgi:hypothetical protein
MPRIRHAALPFLLLTLTACPPRDYGVRSGGTIPAMPDAACVTATLEATPGVTQVSYGSGALSGFNLLPHWGKETGSNHVWTYHLGGRMAWVQVINGRWDKSYSNVIPSRERLDVESWNALLGEVRRINERLTRECGLPPPYEPPARR